jgi:hypothetical protein
MVRKPNEASDAAAIGRDSQRAQITIKTDTRDILSHATIQAEALEDYFLVDIDAHVTETQFWPEILDLIDNDVIRHMGQAVASRPGTSTALLNAQPGTLYQHVYGRIPHQVALAMTRARRGRTCLSARVTLKPSPCDSRRGSVFRR